MPYYNFIKHFYYSLYDKISVNPIKYLLFEAITPGRCVRIIPELY